MKCRIAGFIFVLLLGAAVCGCSPLTEKVMRSERAQEGYWKLVQEELVNTYPDPKVKAMWTDRVKEFILQNRVRIARLEKEPWTEEDWKKNCEELGIKYVPALKKKED
jgi:hypothetical protein